MGWFNHGGWGSLWVLIHFRMLRKFVTRIVFIVSWEKRIISPTIVYKGAMLHLFKVKESCGHYMGVNISGHIDKLLGHFSEVVDNPKIWPDPLDNYLFIVLEMGDR